MEGTHLETLPNLSVVRIENQVARYHVTITNDINIEPAEIKEEIIEDYHIMEVINEENNTALAENEPTDSGCHQVRLDANKNQGEGRKNQGDAMDIFKLNKIFECSANEEVIQENNEILTNEVKTENMESLSESENTFSWNLKDLSKETTTSDFSLKEFKCNHCDLRFITETALSQHCWQNHSRRSDFIKEASKDLNPFECNICGHVLRTKNSLYKHCKRKHDEKNKRKSKEGDTLQENTQIPSSSNGVDILEESQANFENASDSNKTTNEDVRIENESLSDDEDIDANLFECHICGHVLRTKNSLYKHCRRKHNEKNKRKSKEEDALQENTPSSKGVGILEESQENFENASDSNKTTNDDNRMENDKPLSNDEDTSKIPLFPCKTKAALNQQENNEILTNEVKTENMESLPESENTTFSCNLKNLPKVATTSDSSLKQFQCDYCDHRSTTQTALYLHSWQSHPFPRDNSDFIKDTSKDANLYECNICGHVLNTRNSLYKHCQRKHNGENKSKSEKAETLQENTLMPTSSKGVNILEESQANFENTRDSNKTTNDEDIRIENEPLSDEGDIDITKTPKIPLFPCNQCNYKSKTKAALNQHRHRNHRQGIASNRKCRPFRCELCFHSFLTKHSLAQHGHLRHGERTKEYWCEICDLSFMGHTELLQHQQWKHKEKPKPIKKRSSCTTKPPFICDVCGYEVPSHMALIQHRHRKHRNNKILFPFKCHLCGKGFRSVTYLKLHLSSKHRNKTFFVCEHPDCGKLYQSTELLKQHMFVHKDMELCLCEFCEKMFTCSKSLKIHIKNIHDMVIAPKELMNMLVVKKNVEVKDVEDKAKVEETIPVEDDELE